MREWKKEKRKNSQEKFQKADDNMKIRDRENMEERLGIIKCECGYYNHKDKIQKYGTCKFCGKVLDKKSKIRL